MTKQTLQSWLVREFWPIYVSLCKTPYVTKWKAGDKGKAMKAINTLRPSVELRDEIIDWVREVIRHRRALMKQLGTREAYEKHTFNLRTNGIYTNKQASTFINGYGWINDIPSLTETQVAKVIPIKEIICRTQGCGQVAGAGMDYCMICYYKAVN